MRNQPDARELLGIARETFIARILPALPEDLRYTALMVANAMVIARREIEAGEESAQSELTRLRGLFGESAHNVHGFDLHSALADRNRRLARDIRAGRYESDNSAVLAHLRRTVEEKLAVSNPKGLSGK
jgi:hypothetical protein